MSDQIIILLIVVLLQKVYVVMEVFGHVTKIQSVSRGTNVGAALPQTTSKNIFVEHIVHLTCVIKILINYFGFCL